MSHRPTRGQQQNVLAACDELRHPAHSLRKYTHRVLCTRGPERAASVQIAGIRRRVKATVAVCATIAAVGGSAPGHLGLAAAADVEEAPDREKEAEEHAEVQRVHPAAQRQAIARVDEFATIVLCR